jgi:hypothetical protein
MSVQPQVAREEHELVGLNRERSRGLGRGRKRT